MTLASGLRIPASIPADAGVIRGAARLLSHVEELPPDATGVLRFGAYGAVLIESRMICWAVAAGMEPRLSKLLRQQRNPPLGDDYVEDVLRDCKESGRPLAEALLATGAISEEGLRGALFSHVSESIACLARIGCGHDAFQPHQGQGYDPRFVFSTAEILVAIGARRNRALAAAAKRSLQTTLVDGARAVCFVRDSSGPVAIAVAGKPPLKVGQILDVCDWAATLFDVTALFDEGVSLASGARSDAQAVVTWRQGEAQFVAICSNRATSAVMVARIEAALAGDRP